MKYNNLLYRRQFLLANSPVSLFSEWGLIKLMNNKYLYSHPDLPVGFTILDNVQIVLLGNIYDYRSVEKINESILDDIIKKSATFIDFIETIKVYSGQYAFIYINDENGDFNVIQDPLALREVYYCTSLNKVICASQPNLIVEFSKPKIEVTKNKDIIDFYNNEFTKKFSRRNWIGNETYFEGIHHLLPNHFLNINELNSIRYWPNKVIKPISFDDSVNKSCEFLKGTIESASKRDDLMIAVTAGLDSRLLVAASRDIADKVYYFINKNANLTLNHPDIKIPTQIFNDLNLPFNIHETEGVIDPEFAEVFFKNTFIASESSLNSIYNVYYKKNLSNLLNILGIGEIGRNYFGNAPEKINGYRLARLLTYKKSPYAVSQCQKWYDKTKKIADECGVNILTLLYWEQKIGNWGAVGNSESDIVIEEFDPFASHYLLELWFGTPDKYVEYDSSILFYEIIRKMWPDLLDYPVNPPFGRSEKFRSILKKMKLYSLLKKTIHFKDELIYTINSNIKHG